MLQMSAWKHLRCSWPHYGTDYAGPTGIEMTKGSRTAMLSPWWQGAIAENGAVPARCDLFMGCIRLDVATMRGPVPYNIRVQKPL